MWKRYDKPFNGTLIDGDPDAPATRWWLLPYLLWSGWRTTAVFRVPFAAAGLGYRVGYKNADGACRLSGKVLRDVFVRVRIGREPCTFFAVDANGDEVLLRLEEMAAKDAREWQGAPLV